MSRVQKLTYDVPDQLQEIYDSVSMQHSLPPLFVMITPLSTTSELAALIIKLRIDQVPTVSRKVLLHTVTALMQQLETEIANRGLRVMRTCDVVDDDFQFTFKLVVSVRSRKRALSSSPTSAAGGRRQQIIKIVKHLRAHQPCTLKDLFKAACDRGDSDCAFERFKRFFFTNGTPYNDHIWHLQEVQPEITTRKGRVRKQKMLICTLQTNYMSVLQSLDISEDDLR